MLTEIGKGLGTKVYVVIFFSDFHSLLYPLCVLEESAWHYNSHFNSVASYVPSDLVELWRRSRGGLIGLL